jgi:hypothetical protein
MWLIFRGWSGTAQRCAVLREEPLEGSATLWSLCHKKSGNSFHLSAEIGLVLSVTWMKNVKTRGREMFQNKTLAKKVWDEKNSCIVLPFTFKPEYPPLLCEFLILRFFIRRFLILRFLILRFLILRFLILRFLIRRFLFLRFLILRFLILRF